MYPFGMTMPGRSFNASKYRYGFNGKENDNDVKGEGNQQDYGERIYDTRLGKFLSVDPKASKFPWQSPYTAMDDNPINIIDPTGESGEPVIDKVNKTITVTSNITFYGADGTTALATKSAQNIQDQWNAAAGKVTIGADVYDVKFVVSGTYSSTLTASDITSNTDIKNNYVKIVAAGIDVSYMDGAGSNTGEFLVSNINTANSTTETHEFGHGYGLDHPTNVDLRTPAGSTTPAGAPGIMYPRGTAVDAAYTYDPTKGATAGTPRVDATNTMNPATRKVNQTDINNLGLDKVTYDPTTGKGQLGKLTNTSH
jgi:RHS repeat-associated protein